MSAFPATISPVLIAMVLDLLTPLFLRYAGTRQEAADAILDLLLEQHPHTGEELGLIAEVIAFRYRALALVRDSAQPGIPNSAALQLSKTANTMRRNEAAAQRKLDSLRRARLGPKKPAAAEAEAPPPEPPPPKSAEPAPDQPPAAVAALPPSPAPIPPEPAQSAPVRSAHIEAFMQQLAAGELPGFDDGFADMIAAIGRATMADPGAIPNAPGGAGGAGGSLGTS